MGHVSSDAGRVSMLAEQVDGVSMSTEQVGGVSMLVEQVGGVRILAEQVGGRVSRYARRFSGALFGFILCPMRH